MDALLTATGLSKHYAIGRRSLFGTRPALRAVDGVDIRVGPGETIGLLGESGCGKSTLGRLLLHLIRPTAGEVRFEGDDVSRLDGAGLGRFRQRAQIVFQNPFDALNPRLTIARSLSEPLINARVPAAARAELVATALRRVRLPDLGRLLERYPHQLSGGQLQRVVLARALILDPTFLVADEPVSMLDVSVRAGILNVLREVQGQLGLAALYISHDLALVRYVCRRTLVMYLGAIVEDGPTEAVVRTPQHPYARALVEAVPVPRVDQSHAPLPIIGGIGDGTRTGAGCRFRERCPHAFARCGDEAPVLREVAPGHRVACHLGTG